METSEIDPRFRHRGRQPGDEIQWLKDNVGRAIAVRRLQLTSNLAI
jgi:hypothetical protein